MTNTLTERLIDLQDAQIKSLEKARELDKALHAEELKKLETLYAGAVKHVAAERDVAIAVAEDYKEDVQHWQAQFDREHNAFMQAADDRDQAIRDKSDLRRRLHAAHAELAAAEERYDKLSKEGTQLFTDHAKALEFIDNICEMAACDCDLADIADECMMWRRGEWHPVADRIEDLVSGIVNDDPDSFFGGSDTEYADDAVYKGTPWVTTDVKTVEDLEAEDRRRSDPMEPYRWKGMVVDKEGDEAVFTGWFANYDLARESVDLMVERGCHEAWVEELC